MSAEFSLKAVLIVQSPIMFCKAQSRHIPPDAINDFFLACHPACPYNYSDVNNAIPSSIKHNEKMRKKQPMHARGVLLNHPPEEQ